MKLRFRYGILAILTLTTIVAFATLVFVRGYRERVEQQRQMSLRAQFSALDRFVGNLDGEIRQKLIEVPAIEAAMRARFSISEDNAVEGSFLSGGYGGSSERGDLIKTPKFHVNYEYRWNPSSRVANAEEVFHLKMHSVLKPAEMEKPLLIITTRGSDLEEEISGWIVGQLDSESLSIERRIFRDE